jgi:uncharacterized protein with HEPN domain
MQLESKKLLADMLRAAHLIKGFSQGRSLLDFQQDQMLRAAIYMEFVVIGESLTKLHKIDEATADGISEAHRIIGFRNQIVHGYQVLRDETTWKVVETKLAILIEEVETFLAA